jgi:hypothetical protein
MDGKPVCGTCDIITDMAASSGRCPGKTHPLGHAVSSNVREHWDSPSSIVVGMNRLSREEMPCFQTNARVIFWPGNRGFCLGWPLPDESKLKMDCFMHDFAGLKPPSSHPRLAGG